jgi:hypothetical protein
VPSRSTQCNILVNVFELVEPLLDFFKSTVQTDGIIGCDDTSVTLLYPKTLPAFDRSDPKQRRIQELFREALDKKLSNINGKMWAYRGWSTRLNVFDFTVSRHRDELLNVKEFENLAEARWFAGRRKEKHNHERPHSSLGYRRAGCDVSDKAVRVIVAMRESASSSVRKPCSGDRRAFGAAVRRGGGSGRVPLRIRRALAATRRIAGGVVCRAACAGGDAVGPAL